MKRKSLFLILLTIFVGITGHFLGLDFRQTMVMSIFSVSILGTLFFWEFRLSFVFMGSGLLLLIHAVDMETFIRFASLEVILFLISMMILVGMMKEAGFFLWFITSILRVKNLDGRKMFVLIMVISWLLSGLMDEVTSIIIIATAIFDICIFLEVSPVPLLISSVLATNIGSTSTVLGNPIGILIATKSKLTFGDFIVHALPVSLIIFVITIFILLFWYRQYLKELSSKLKDYAGNDFFSRLISIPPDQKTKTSMLIFGITILLIALHGELEVLFGLEKNTLLIILPIISAGIVMLYRHDKARHYVEREVEWNSLLFFLFLFAESGVMQSSGVAGIMAEKIVKSVGQNPAILSGVILFSSGILSSMLDNVVVVSTYIPIVKNIAALHPWNLNPVWWAILFGACHGGNITMIGSTANIVALGLLEKKFNIKIRFLDWLKVGLVIGFLGMVLSTLYLFIRYF